MGAHDKLFKAVFSEPKNVIAHLEGFLPPEVTAALDLAKATHEPGSFVDEALKERHTDLLYRIPWRQNSGEEGREVLLFCIFEHQSSVDSMMPYRMLGYAVRVWDHWLAEHPDQKLLPPILPLVLYHGEQDWTAATELQEVFDVQGVEPEAVEALRPFLPKLQIMLNEVATQPKEKFPGHPVVRLTLHLLRYGRLSDLLLRLRDLEDDFREVVDQDAPDLRILRLFVHYILTVNEYVTVDELVEFLAPMGDKAKEIPMTVGEQLIEKGRQEGEMKGRQEGEMKGRQEGEMKGRRENQLEVARKALAKGMSPSDVADLTELPLEEVQTLAH
jgi:predicted transposase YdaD